MPRKRSKIEEVIRELRRELAICAMAMKKATDNYEELEGKKRVSDSTLRVALEDIQKVQVDIAPAIEFIMESYKFAKEASDAHQRFLEGINGSRLLGKSKKEVEEQIVIK